MMTLREHEERFWKDKTVLKEWGTCGVSCPKCGEELEQNLFMVLASNPPQRRVRCSKCDYVGSIH